MAPRWLQKAGDAIKGLGARRLTQDGAAGDPMPERPLVNLDLPWSKGRPGTADQRDAIREAQKRCEEWEEERLEQAREWEQILAYYGGMQNRHWRGRDLFRLDDKAVEWKVVMNLLARYVRLVAATLGEQKPVARTIPATNDDEDIWAAEIGKKVLLFLQKELGEEKKSRRLRTMVLLLGKGFRFRWWDARADARIALDEGGVMDREGAWNLEGGQRIRSMAVGQCASEIVNPFEFLAGSFVSSLDEQPRFAIRKLRTLEWIGRQYPDAAGYEHQMEKPGANGKFQAWQQLLYLARFAATRRFQDSRVVTHYVTRGVNPDNGQPDYRVICYSGDVFLGEWRARRNPATEYTCFDEEGYFWGSGLGALLLPGQKENDAVWTDLRTHRRLHTHPMWTCPGGASVTVTNTPGEMIYYDPDPVTGAKPEIVTPPSLNADLHRYKMYIEEMFKVLSNQHDVSQAQTPQGVTAARAIGLLQESDLRAWGEFAHSWNTSEADHYRGLLDIVQLKWDVPRVIASIGRESRLFVEAVLGANLESVQDVVFEMGPRVMSQEERLELGTQLADKGYFQPARAMELEKILEFAGMGGPVETDATPEGVARKLAQIVIKKLREGEYFIFEPWHNIGIILNALRMEVNKPEFLDLPPDVRRLFGEALAQAENLQFAEQARAQGQMAAIQQLGMMGGGAGTQPGAQAG